MKHSKSSLFLMELIIAILFFALASTVCIQLFVKSHVIAEQTTNQNQAVIQVQNLADAFIASDGDMATMMSWFPNHSIILDNEFLLFFDEKWQPCTVSEGYFQAMLSYTGETDGLLTAEIIVLKREPGEIIHQQHIDHYIQQRSGYHE